MSPLTDPARLRRVWRQDETPVILRRTGKGEKNRVRLPFSLENMMFLRALGGREPEWFPRDGDKPGFWEVPKSWFNRFVDAALRKYGKVYVIQPFQEKQVCARQCMNATGHDCECSCMGANHGAGTHGGWFEVSDTFAVRWGERELACRLLAT